MSPRVVHARVTALMMVVVLLSLPVVARAHGECSAIREAGDASVAAGHQGCGQASTRLGCDCTEHANPQTRPLQNAQSRVDPGARAVSTASAILVSVVPDSFHAAFNRPAPHGYPPLDLPTFLHTLLI